MNNQNQLIKILISGEGGQGVQTIARILARSCYRQKYEVCYMPHYGVEMRMGISLSYLQIAIKDITYPKFSQADILVCLTSRDLHLTKTFYSRNTQIINAMNFGKFMLENKIPAKSLNMLVLGILVRKFKDKLPLETQKVREEIRNALGEKKGILENIESFTKGINLEEKYFCVSLDKFPRKNLHSKTIENRERQYTHLPSHCKACGLCIEVCPTKALWWSKTDLNYFGRPIPIVNIEKCITCKTCEQLCPDMAIKVTEKK